MTNSTIATHESSSVLRSVGVVFAGFAFIAILSSAVDAVLHATGVFPAWGESMSNGLFLLATAYRALISIGGCWLAAKLAPRHPMRHALALGGVGVVVSTVGVIVAWKAALPGPLWYPLLLVAIAPACAWIGGRLHVRTALP